jgi:hypothetical protein
MSGLDFTALGNLLASDPISIESILACEQIRMAFKNQFAPLLAFLGENLLPITRIALGRVSSPNPATVASAFYIFTTFVPAFSNRLGTDVSFIEELLSIFTLSDPISEYSLLSFSSIFQCLVQSSSGFVFGRITDKLSLMTHLLAHINTNPIFELLTAFTTKVSAPITQFLENTDSTILILKSFVSEEETNARLLELLIGLVNNSVPSDTLFLPLLDLAQIQQLFESAIAGKTTHFSSRAADLLAAICRRTLSGNLQKPQEAAIQLLAGKIPEICARIATGDRYDLTKNRLVALVILLNEIAVEPIPQKPLIELAKSLFDLVFLNEGHTILHADFLAFLECVGLKEKVIAECGFAKRIPQAFAKRGANFAVYWGALRSVAEMLVKAKVKIRSAGWEKFVGGEYATMGVLMKSAYGGKVPGQEDEEDDDSYYSEEEAEHEGEGDYSDD